jgi:hypothetical protein
MPSVGSLSYLSWVFDVSFCQLCVVVSGYIYIIVAGLFLRLCSDTHTTIGNPGLQYWKDQLLFKLQQRELLILWLHSNAASQKHATFIHAYPEAYVGDIFVI